MFWKLESWPYFVNKTRLIMMKSQPSYFEVVQVVVLVVLLRLGKLFFFATRIQVMICYPGSILGLRTKTQIFPSWTLSALVLVSSPVKSPLKQVIFTKWISENTSNIKKPECVSFFLSFFHSFIHSFFHSSQIFPSCDWLRCQFLAGVLASQ